MFEKKYVMYGGFVLIISVIIYAIKTFWFDTVSQNNNNNNNIHNENEIVTEINTPNYDESQFVQKVMNVPQEIWNELTEINATNNLDFTPI